MKFFLFIFLLFNFSFASSSIEITQKNVLIYKNTQILNKNLDIHNAILSKEFKDNKHLYYALRKSLLRNLWIKFSLKNVISEKVNKAIYTTWHNASLNIYFVKKNKISRYHKLKQISENNFITDNFKLQAGEQVDVYIKVNTQENLDEFKSLHIVNYNPETLSSFFKKEWFEKGFTLGLLVMMLFFSLIIYFSTKLRAYLYYFIFLLSLIVGVSNIKWCLLEQVNVSKSMQYLFNNCIITAVVTITLILFTKEFFNIKKENKLINTLLNIFIVINIVMVCLMYYKLPEKTLLYYPNLLLPFLIVVGAIFYKQHGKLAVFYIFGIISLMIPILLQSLILLLNLDMYNDLLFYLHISASICSVWIALAAYVYLKRIVLEKIDYEKQINMTCRFTAMGEMIANIAHQWRQPLSSVSSILMSIQIHESNNALSSKILNNYIDRMNTQLIHMSNTINDFMNFFSTNKEKKIFTLSKTIESVLVLMEASFKMNYISVLKNIKSDNEVFGNINELIQVLTIILNNAQDSLKNQNNEARQISILIEKNSISIENNGDSINEAIINKIFDPYFSTKIKKNGHGLGLYTAKNIIENTFGGSITVANNKKGVVFKIYFQSTK